MYVRPCIPTATCTACVHTAELTRDTSERSTSHPQLTVACAVWDMALKRSVTIMTVRPVKVYHRQLSKSTEFSDQAQSRDTGVHQRKSVP